MGCYLRSQNVSACALMLKKKLLPLMIELVVTWLNHLGVIRL